ncbi:hypothetical protein FA13DRAFT_1718727 [Coprinellus micaceus]|uniref:Uncharacterized protein n=1 Tax=Coprinellus micaceus TaxID=71717 RepID=A0A4Y7SD01_COPMI|nr:hypothetical protein FA13DRAFT_1718727 [Coprinellus micaceus]
MRTKKQGKGKVASRGDGGKRKKNPNKPAHLGERWELLDEDKKKVLIERGKKAWNQYLKLNDPLNNDMRCWARRAQCFLPQCASENECMAASIFITANGRTVCHYHTVFDHESTVNDFAPATQKSKSAKVTGVHYSKHVNSLEKPGYLKRDPPVKGVHHKATTNQKFTLSRVYDFFLHKNKDNEGYLHCGCSLRETLMDFFVWKRTTLYSQSTQVREGLARPMRPRDHVYLCDTLELFGVRLENLYRWSNAGERVIASQRITNHIRILTETKLQVVQEEKAHQCFLLQSKSGQMKSSEEEEEEEEDEWSEEEDFEDGA